MKLTDARIAELREKRLPHADASIWGAEIKAGTPEEIAKGEILLATINEYLAHFVKGDNDCINCGKPQGASGLINGLLNGARFKWGITHGEGYCSNCGYPGRAMHYIGDDALVVRNYILQYHPDSLLTASERKPKPEYA